MLCNYDLLKMTMDRQRELIRKILAGKASKEDMEEMADFPLMMRCMKKQWNAGSSVSPDAEMEERIWKKIETECLCGRNRHRVLRWNWWVAAACIVAMVAVGWWYGNSHWEISSQRIESVAVSDRMLVLPDSSEVWLKAGSRLSYNEDFSDDRCVWLEGEAVFDVRKQEENNTFKVFLGNDFIEVKGTAFRVVNLERSHLEIDLFHGKIDFNIGASGRKVPMKPYQSLCYMPDGENVILAEMEPIDWVDGHFCFKNMKTDVLLRAVERIYRQRIVLRDAVGEGEYFNGRIRIDETLSEALDKICFSLGAHYRRMDDGSYLLYR